MGKKNVRGKTTSNFVSDSLFNALKWRNIGPFRSGRSLAVAGHANHPLTYYFGQQEAFGKQLMEEMNGFYF
jgi:hypothetical protein